MIYQIDATAWIIFVLGLIIFVLGAIALVVVQIQIKKLKRERHRLDRLLNRYNTTYKDDYDFYNGF